MTVKFFYKGLSVEDRIFPQTIDSSVKLSKGTLYEAWFETMQTSPWYRKSVETKVFRSTSSEEAFEKFGDLRSIDFQSWWKLSGYKLFSENIPYKAIEISNFEIRTKITSTDKKPPSLQIEVPLNLHPKSLREQFEQILRLHSDYFNEKNDRWDHSTADIHQYRESKLSYQTISRWLNVYRAFEKQKHEKDFTLYNFAKQMQLHPSMFKNLPKKSDVPVSLRIEAANVASDILKQVHNLMAHATELRFPCTDHHEWVVTQKRSKKSN